MNKRLLFRSFFIGFLLFGLFFSIGFIKRYHIPKFQNWILLEIEQYSRANLPVRIWPKSVEISFFPLGLKFNDIDILPKNKLAQQLAPISIKDISLQLNIFSLLIGEVRLSSVQINNPEVLIETELTQKESDKTEGIKVDKDLPKELSVKALSKYPVDEIYINNLNLMVRDSNKAYSLKANDLDFTLKNLTGLILLEVNSPKISFLKHKTKSLFNALVDAKLLLNDDSIHLSSFKFKNEESYIVASGLIEGQWLKKNFSKIQLNTRSQIEFDSLVKNLNPFIKNQLPLIEGSMNLDLSYNKEKTELISFDLNSNKVFISKHELGQVVLKGSLDNGDLKIQRLSAHTSAGHVKFKDFTLLDKEKYRFKSVVQIPQLEIRQLLRSIQVGDTPMRINVQGELPCEGVVKPKFELNCKKGNLKISDFLVHSGLPAKKTIIAVKEIDINGDLSVDQEKVSYTGNLQINDSKGSSHGVIDFKKGFNIYYDTDELDFKNIESFLDLDFEGKVKLHGNTVGTSKWATVDMDASTQDFWFENYKLDRSKFHFSYKNSYLKFLNIKGQQRTSDYSGLVSINLKKDKIYLKLNSTFLDTQDILQSFSRKVTLPFEISGTGHAEVKAWGPLQFNILNYDFKAALFRGQFAKESYDEAFAHIISENGNVKTKNFYINKGAGKIQIESKVQPNGLMDTQIIGRGLKIEESKNINRLNLDMKGILNINTHLKGHILHPDTEIVGSASSVKIGETPMSNSNFKLKLNSEYFQGSGFLMDKSVVADFKIPFKEDEEFWFKFDSKNWSFTRFFSIFSNNEEQKKYQTSADIHLDVRSQRGGFWTSTGDLIIEKVKLKKNNISMFNPEPMKIKIKNGKINSSNFKLVGNNSYIEFIADGLTKNNLNSHLKGQMKMTLLNILTPLQDLGGDLNFNLNFSGSVDNPDIKGEAFVKNGFARIAAFPHPLESISAHAILADKKIIFDRARGVVANGTLETSGQVRFVDFGNIPIDLSANVRNANIEFPKNISTSGNALVKISGNWFPYKLEIDYDVRKGVFAREFSEEESSIRTVRPSSFLPKFLDNDNFQTFNLDVAINMAKPLLVKNSQADAQFTGQLKIVGTPENPLFSGRVNTVQEGSLVFRSNEFEIVNASINYDSSPVENPKLYITAQTQISSDDLTYEIKLLIQGTANKPEISMTSLPPLQEYEIVSLLAIGMTSEQADENVGTKELAEQTSYQLGSALLASPLGKQIKNRFGFDFQISSEFDEDNEVIPKVTIKRQITKKLDATATRTLEQNPRNNVKVKYKFNNNLSVIGSWDGNEATSEDQNSSGNSSILGLDLEYKFKFR